MSLVILEDIIKKKMRDLTDSDAAKLCKIIGKSINPLSPNTNIHILLTILLIFLMLLVGRIW